MAAQRYEKVKFQDGEKIRTVFLRIVSDGAGSLFLRGIEVDKNGDEVSGKDFDQRTRIIDKNCIKSRQPYEISLKYGWLVPKEG